MWKWGNNEEQAFRALKLALQQAPTLKLPDFSQKFIVTTDASGYCMGGVLSQKFQDGEHPIAFYSKKFGPYEAKWPAHEKELLAIKTALEKWRPYLHGRPFDVYTDNSACSWMLHHPKVSPKMARFLTFFSQFEFVLHHVRGTSNVVADGLSRPPQESGNECANEEIDIPDVKYKVHNCDDECITHALATNQHRVGSAAARHMPVDVSSLLLDDVHLLGECRLIGVQQEQVHSVDIHSVRVHLSPEVKKKFQSGYAKDPAFEKVWKSLTPDSTFVKFNGLLFLKTSNSVFRLCVPSDKKLITQVIMEFHDAPTSAHPGIRRTQLKTAQWYYWPTLDKDIKEYVNSCETCARWKSSNRMKNGLLMPIPVPQECWEVVSMDFIVKLPVSNGYDAIFVAVDKLSKRAKYAPTHTTSNAEDTARVFFDAVVRHHGVPKIIISDRDPKFISDFWKSLMKIMGIKLSMTTSHRPQADGQTERQNLVLEDALRCVVSYHGDDWNRHLGTIEYAHATLVNVSTKMSPFELDTGRKVSNLIAEEINGIASSDFTVSIAEYAKRFATERQKIVNQARRNLLQAQERQKNDVGHEKLAIENGKREHRFEKSEAGSEENWNSHVDKPFIIQPTVFPTSVSIQQPSEPLQKNHHRSPETSQCGYAYMGPEVTNNWCEYSALKDGLAYSAHYLQHYEVKLEVFGDSQMIIAAQNWFASIRQTKLQPLAVRVNQIIADFAWTSWDHTKREQNKMADLLANMATSSKSAKILAVEQRGNDQVLMSQVAALLDNDVGATPSNLDTPHRQQC
ncbi:polyprotein, partial [Globisporangium splendens]